MCMVIVSKVIIKMSNCLISINSIKTHAHTFIKTALKVIYKFLDYYDN